MSGLSSGCGPGRRLRIGAEHIRSAGSRHHRHDRSKSSLLLHRSASMAEGEPLNNVQDLMNDLPNVPAGGGQPPPLQELNINVVSWNIKGENYAGTAEARYLLVPGVVCHLNPAVLILQNIPSESIIQQIISEQGEQNGRNYGDDARAVAQRAAMILYDKNIFTMEEVDIADLVETNFPSLQSYNEQMIAVRLHHNDANRDVIFMSFRNKLHKEIGGRDHVRQRATNFCNLMARLIAIETGVPIVAGVDLRCALFNPGIISIPNYEPTFRREHSTKVDYFLHSPDSQFFTVGNDVTPENIFPNEGNHQVVENLGNPDQQNPTYRESLIHDPLVYNLNINY